MSLLKKLAGETALYGLSSIIGRFINYLILVPLYTRVFAPGEYGVVSQLYAYSGFLMVLFSYRLESAFFRFGNEQTDRQNVYSTAMLSLIGSTTLLVVSILLFSGTIADWLDYTAHPEYIRYFALIIGLDCLCELPFAKLRLEQRPRHFVAARLLNIGVNILFTLFWLVVCPWAATQGFSWINAVWSPHVGVGYVFLANLIASAVTVLFLLPQIRHIQLHFDWVLWKKMIRYAAPLMIAGFAGIANEMLDRAVMPYLLTGTDKENMATLGIYSATYKLAMMITLFTQAYRYAAEPFFFRTAQNADSLKLQADSTKWFTIIGTVGMLGILLFLDIIKWFLGKRFQSGLDAVPVLLLANLFLGLFYNFSVWYRLTDRTMTGAWISIFGALLTLLLNIWWVPLMGYMGAAWATLACYIFMSAATWWTGRVLHPVPYPLARMGAFVGLALGMYMVSLWMKPLLPGTGLPLLGNGVLMVGYLGVVWMEYRRNP